MTDNEIVKLYFDRDEKALSECEKKYGTYCNKIALGIVGRAEDAEECLNDTWLKAWASIPPAQPHNLKCYLGRLSRNIALNHLRAQKAAKRGGDVYTQSVDELSECISDGSSPEKQAEDKFVTDAINSFLESLDKEKRVIFVKRYWYIKSTADISREMGISESKVKTTLFRLRKQLKAYLEQEGIEI